MSEKNTPSLPRDTLVETFHALAALGEEILLPLSVTEDTLKRDPRKDPEKITSYLHRFDYGSFFISLVYTPAQSDLTAAPSTLEARICLDKSEHLLFFMPYDIIPYVNPQDMICRYFPYIESPERMRSCYRDLAESLIPYLADFHRIANDAPLCERAYHDLRGEMSRCYRENVEERSPKGVDYDNAMMALRFSHFVRWKSAFYSSSEYSRYLEGDASSVSAMAFRGVRPDYVKHIALTAASDPNPSYLPVREESASLPAMNKATKKARTLGILLLTVLLALPVTLLLLGICYFGTAYFVGSGSLYFTALSYSGFFSNIFWIVTMAFAIAYTAYPLTLRLFFKKRYQAYLPYHRMMKTNKHYTPASRSKKLLIIAALIFTVFSACRGAHFCDDAIRVQSSIIPRAPISFSYEDIVSVEEITRKNGSFYYVITFEDEKKLSLESVMDKKNCDIIAGRLSIVFTKHGVTVTKDQNDTHLDGDYDTTNQA